MPEIADVTDKIEGDFPILNYFEYSHLPADLQELSKPFHEMAWNIVNVVSYDRDETTTALRKLLEAKDCVVRAGRDHMSRPF